MPDDKDKPRVVPDPQSGVVNVHLPAKTAAHVEVHPDPGTGEAPVVVESDPAPQPERRRPPAQSVVNVQPQTAAGLPGVWGYVANATGVGMVFLLAFLMFMYLQKQHDASIQILREELKLSREMSMDSYQSLRDEIRQGRDIQARSIDAFVIAATAFKDGMGTMTVELRAATTEAKAGREALNAKLDKIIAGLKDK
jgi:hypothetical protein